MRRYQVLVPKFLWSSTDIDGAYFGTTFPHLFLMTYGHLKPQKPSQSYTPRIFGFKSAMPSQLTAAPIEPTKLKCQEFYID
ncbi:hypothetical protein QQ045_008571 [Rhodiola kirilowii]